MAKIRRAVRGGLARHTGLETSFAIDGGIECRLAAPESARVHSDFLAFVAVVETCKWWSVGLSCLIEKGRGTSPKHGRAR